MAQSLPLNRNIQDANLVTTVAMPNANASTYSAAIDLGSPNAAFVNENCVLHVSVPNTNIVSALTTTFTLESADVNLNANYSAVTGAGVVSVVGIAGNVSAAADVLVPIPGIAKQFLRIKGVGGANTGTALTETITVSLRF